MLEERRMISGGTPHLLAYILFSKLICLSPISVKGGGV